MKKEVSSLRDLSREEELHTLVREGDKANVKRLLIKEGKREHNIADYKLNGKTAPHVAARVGNTEIVEVLIKVGHADIHAESDEGDTPLHLAAQYGHEAVVKKLLKQGAVSDIGVRNQRGDIPLHGAARSGKVNIVKQMASKATIWQACVNAKNNELRVPLHYAAGSGNFELVNLLFDIRKKGGLKDVRDETGAIPFHFAARSGDVKSLKMLVRNDINVTSNNGFTALHYAAWNANINAVKWLIDNEATVAYKDSVVITPLHLACICNKPGSDEVAEIILHKLAEQDQKLEEKDRLLKVVLEMEEAYNSIWRTPLHWAASRGKIGTLKALAKAGAHLTQVNKRGETPLFLALGEGHMKFAEELLKCDKEITCKRRGRCLTKDEWMEGVDHWMMTYYNDKVPRHVKDELYNGFTHHTRKQLARQFPAPASNEWAMFQEIPPLYLALHAGRLDIAQFLQHLSSDDVYAVNKKGFYTGRTTLHWAVLLRRPDILNQLCFEVLDFRETIRPCEEDNDGIAPIQYATELNLQETEAKLLKRDGVSSYMKSLYRDRQIYVDSTNAILVGAALIASVTFAGWLQPPLGYPDPGPYVDIKNYKGIRIFWVFNSLSFFAAVGTVQAGAYGVLPLHHVHIGRAVIYIRRALMVASLLMALSVICVLGAFSVAGFVVLPPFPKYEVYMAGTVAFGGLINTCIIIWFFQRVLIAPQFLQVWKRHLRRRIPCYASPPPTNREIQLLAPVGGQQNPISYWEKLLNLGM